MNKFLRDAFLLNAIEREIDCTNRAVNNGNDDKMPYLQAGRQLLKELVELAELAEAERQKEEV